MYTSNVEIMENWVENPLGMFSVGSFPLIAKQWAYYFQMENLFL